ncbi:MAG: LptA/OstA family protein, partial [bacterium]
VLVKSDKASYNNQKKLSIYQGSVEITKGPGRMKADRIEGINDDSGQGFKSIAATGSVVFDIEEKQGCAQRVYYYGGSAVLPKEKKEEKPDSAKRLHLFEKMVKKILPLPAEDFERMIMEINPKIAQEGNLVLGDWMRYIRLLDVLEVYGNVFVHYRSTARDKDRKRSRTGKKADTGKKPKGKEVSTYIYADNAIFYRSVHQVFFYGKIKVYREGMTLRAKRMTAYLDEGMKKLDRLVADRNVDVRWENRHLTAGKGVFYERKQKLVLTDHPVAVQGRSKMTGFKMVYDLANDLVTVQKAYSTINPKDFNKRKSAGGNQSERK